MSEEPSRSRLNTIFVPSGDHWGRTPVNGLSTTRRSSELSAAVDGRFRTILPGSGSGALRRVNEIEVAEVAAVKAPVDREERVRLELGVRSDQEVRDQMLARPALLAIGAEE